MMRIRIDGERGVLAFHSALTGKKKKKKKKSNAARCDTRARTATPVPKVDYLLAVGPNFTPFDTVVS
jgi:hypothetical protein